MELRHGYTLDDAHRLARIAVATDRGHSNRDYLERLDVAFGGVVERLYGADGVPVHGELVQHGRDALRDDKQAEMRFRGVSHRDMQPMMNHWRYWWLQCVPAASPEGRVVERVSLYQVWPLLRPGEQEALLALAAWEDYQRAADAIGVSYQTFCQRINRGRGRFLAALLAGETPRPTWGRDRRAGRKGVRATSGMTAARKVHRRHQMQGGGA